MLTFAIRRIAATAMVLLLVTVIAFYLLRVSPGDPARLVLGPLASASAVARLRRQMGLDGSLPDQYWHYLHDLLTGNLGMAWHVDLPVSTVLTQRLPATAELALSAAVLAVLIALPLGSYAARKPGGWADRLAKGFGIVGLGTPVFWLGLVLIVIFFFWLHIAPAPLGQLSQGVDPPAPITHLVVIDALLRGEFATFGNALAHLALPAITLGIPTASYLTQVVRQSVADVYDEDFIELVRSKGVSERRVMVRHALRNALLPVLTLVALSIGDLLGGSLLVEAVFSWPGIGGFVAESISAQDYAPVEAAVIISAFTYSCLNLIADLLYGVIDPRVRVATGRSRRERGYVQGGAEAEAAGP